jgi:Na+/H+ antiporter NhaD/arsenite permease-like protein
LFWIGVFDVAAAAIEHNGPSSGSPKIVMLSGRKFLLACASTAAVILVLGRWVSISPWLVAGEVFATILALFLLGSFKYQLHKNALTYGSAMVILATFLGAWWTQHQQLGIISRAEISGWLPILRYYLLSFQGLDKLVHADTMLFILGLTLFVCVIAQTRLLEDLTFLLLRRSGGYVLPTVIALMAVVSFASGILDGVSMIGLSIRTLLMILVLARAPAANVRYAIMVCTIVTTVCGMWLAYGEPPNLIMKANLISPEGRPYLDDAFFLRYCLPAAMLSFLCVAWSLRRRLGGARVDLGKLDVLDAHAGTVRFLQASRHGAVFTPIEFTEDHRGELGDQFENVLARVRNGEPFGAALVRSQVPEMARRQLLGRYVDETLADELDQHYVMEAQGKDGAAKEGGPTLRKVLAQLRTRRNWARAAGAFALMPFVALLIAHAMNHEIPLFLAPFAGLAVAILGIVAIPPMRRLALKEAIHEYAEYYFLFPLFLSITLLTKIGFFDQLQNLVQEGISHLGVLAMAQIQFTGATGLSAILDNNVVADFASRAVHGLPVAVVHLFAMAQIAGYAVGGCWTHIGSAQSVVAYAFIRRTCDSHYTPIQWISEMTGVLLLVVFVLALLICVESVIGG